MGTFPGFACHSEIVVYMCVIQCDSSDHVIIHELCHSAHIICHYTRPGLRALNYIRLGRFSGMEVISCVYLL